MKNKNKNDTQISFIIFAIFLLFTITIFIIIYFKLRSKIRSKIKKALIINNKLPNQIIFINPGDNNDNLCWVDFFTYDKTNDISDNITLLKRPKHINKPDIVYVQKGKKYNFVQDLAKNLNTTLNDDFDLDNIKNLVNDIMLNKTKNILICWKSDVIPYIVKGIINELYINVEDCDISSENDKKLVWGYNPYNLQDNINDFSTIWVVNFLDNRLTLTTYKGINIKDDKTCDFNLVNNNFQYQKYPCQSYFQVEYFYNN